MRFTTIIITAALAAAAQPALAETDETQVSVSYADLDLSREADAQIMLDRLEAAAREACGGDTRYRREHRLSRNQARREFEGCVSTALRGAVADLDAPQVRRAYAATAAGPLG